jgi:hypothetical protein
MKEANREGMKGIEASPASIVGLGDGVIISVASAPTIIITTTNRATYAYLTDKICETKNTVRLRSLLYSSMKTDYILI